MQPTPEQVERSLADLRHPGHRIGGDAGEVEVTVPVPASIADALSEVPPIREDAVDRARRRLAAGEQPTDDELAAKVVGRLVCDRLR
jgi:hypothetical protein